MACLKKLCSEVGETLILPHLINLYSPKNLCGVLIKLIKRVHHAIVTSVDDDKNRDRMEQFVVIATRDNLSATTPSIPES